MLHMLLHSGNAEIIVNYMIYKQWHPERNMTTK